LTKKPSRDEASLTSWGRLFEARCAVIDNVHSFRYRKQDYKIIADLHSDRQLMVMKMIIIMICLPVDRVLDADEPEVLDGPPTLTPSTFRNVTVSRKSAFC